jgi:hypothetical protein
MTIADKKTPQTCYLCGLALLTGGFGVDRDHVPPKQFFPESLRKRVRPQLLTLPAHRDCQKAYQSDEDYFVYTVGSASHGTLAATALMDHTIVPAVRRLGYGERVARMILGSVSQRHNGVWLPPGTAIMRFSGARVTRISWKIVRGLWFAERRTVLPAEQKVSWRIYTRDDPPPPITYPLLRTEPKSKKYAGVFTYWSLATAGANGKQWETWALLFWDATMFFGVFHNPSCRCSDCGSEAATGGSA